jgi:hypothetical protein
MKMNGYRMGLCIPQCGAILATNMA